MDHHEQHHQHHQKEREERLAHEQQAERREDEGLRQIHPAWFVAVGAALLVLVVLVWIFAV